MMWVSVQLLADQFHPLIDPPWEEISSGINKKEIQAAIMRGQLEQLPPYNSMAPPETRQQHINRIAWYVVNGWGDSYITIDLNAPFICWPVTDGNHRLAAAIYRGDDMIWADVYGSQEQIKKILYEDDEEEKSQAAQSVGAPDAVEP